MPAQYVGLKDRMAAAARATIKVGLDEWVIVRKDARVELCTDGLSECVAVVMFTSEQAYLAHIFSDAGKNVKLTNQQSRHRFETSPKRSLT